MLKRFILLGAVGLIIFSLSACGEETTSPHAADLRPSETALLINKTWRLKSKQYEYENVRRTWETIYDEGNPITERKTLEVSEKVTETFDGERTTRIEQTITDPIDGPRTETKVPTEQDYLEEIFFGTTSPQVGYYRTYIYDKPCNNINPWAAGNDEFWGWVDHPEALLYLPTPPGSVLNRYFGTRYFDVAKLTENEFHMGYQDVNDLGDQGYQKVLVRAEYEKVDTPHCPPSNSDTPPPPAPLPPPSTTTSIGAQACNNSVDLTGTWEVEYACEDGTRGSQVVHAEKKRNYGTFKIDGVSAIFSGPVCNDVFRWSGTTPEYEETGTWQIKDANSFDKDSRFVRNSERGRSSGTACRGTGTRKN